MTWVGDWMIQTKVTEQKEQTAAWDKQCKKLLLKYSALTLVTGAPLLFPFFYVFWTLVELLTPLISGDLAYGQAGYYEYLEAKDLGIIALAVLLVLNIAWFLLMKRWYKKRIRALGPRPGGYPGKWKRRLRAA
jgi:hypothetical protein